MGFGRAGVLAIVAAISMSTSFATGVEVDENLASYERTSGVSGSLSSVGSDTLNNLMTLWAEGFTAFYPNVRVQIEGKGSSTAPPALIAGTAQLGPMSRAMKSKELDDFEKRFGYKPTPIRVAIDALAVFVHKDNPIEKLSFEELDAIFSVTRECGHDESIEVWGDLGLGGVWSPKPISVYGRNSASGTYGFFKELALCNGSFKDTVKEQPGSASVVQGITEDRFGIGYSGIGYRTSGVRTVQLSKDGEHYFGTDPNDVYAGRYPLARFLYVYVNKRPNQPLDPLVREFLRFVLSSEGQEVVVKDRYLPLGASMADKELAKLE